MCFISSFSNSYLLSVGILLKFEITDILSYETFTVVNSLKFMYITPNSKDYMRYILLVSMTTVLTNALHTVNAENVLFTILMCSNFKIMND